MIKQIQLFDNIENNHNLEQSEQNCYDQIGVWYKPENLSEGQLKMLDYRDHLRDRSNFIAQQETELSNLIADGWAVITSYHLDHGVRGCQIVLYKADDV